MSVKPNKKFFANKFVIAAVLLIIISVFSSCGAKISEEELTIDNMIETIMLGDINYALKLVKSGYDINQTDEGGRTALMYASFIGRLDALKMLIENGADINMADGSGDTALILSARQGNPWIVRELIENGADLNAADSSGETALFKAAGIGSELMCYMLVSNGADIEALRNDGETVIQVAERREWAILDFLVRLKNNPSEKISFALACVTYPAAVKMNDNRWKWETVFLELNGEVGYTLKGTGYILDANGDKWTTEGKYEISRGTVKVSAGGEKTDSYWAGGGTDAKLMGGIAIFTWEGEDDLGHPIVIYEIVQFNEGK